MATFDLQTVKSQLRQKSTFELGVQSLESFFSGSFVSASDADRWESLRLVSRTFALLQSRYSGLPFWKAGERLFATAKDVSSDWADAGRMDEYLSVAKEFISEAEGEGSSARDGAQQSLVPQSSYLFEGQLTEPKSELLPDDGNRFEDILQILNAAHLDASDWPLDTRERDRGRARGNHESNEVQEGEVPGGEMGGQTAGSEQQEPEDQHGNADEFPVVAFRRFIQTHLPIFDEPCELPELPPLGAEESDLLSLAGTLLLEDLRPAPCPASKRAVADLPRDKVTEKGWKGMGLAKSCVLCNISYGVGDEIIRLPCHHIQHTNCLMRWLEGTNCCPICRHELPTDDQDYEIKKERKKEEEEERRGVANAISHREFLYI